MFACQQCLLESNPVLEFICSEANKLTNQGIYFARQWYFKTGEYIDKFDLNNEYKSSKHFKALYSQAAQQVLGVVYEAFRAYKALLKLWRVGELPNRPQLPNYRTKGGLAAVS